MRGQRRLITEPLLTGIISKLSLTTVGCPWGFEKRWQLRYCTNLAQTDFAACHDTIPLQEFDVRHGFVFCRNNGLCYQLAALPPGVRWSICITRVVTSAIGDTAAPVKVFPLMGNIMTAGGVCQASAFLWLCWASWQGMERVTLYTSLNREGLPAMSDGAVLGYAFKANMLLGEGCCWNAWLGECLARCSHKTTAKLSLAARHFPHHSCRTSAGMLLLALFVSHALSLNPTSCYTLLKAHRAVHIGASARFDWDNAVLHVSALVADRLFSAMKELQANSQTHIPDAVWETYAAHCYDLGMFTAAAVEG